MLNAGERMFAYRFEGYWKDVGTIDSLWEANMDMLHPKAGLDLSREDWKIYSRNPVVPPQYIAKGAKVQNSLVGEGCNVYGDLEFSILFQGVYVAPGAEVLDSIVMPGAVIEEGAKVQYAIVAENAVVGKNAVIGNASGGYGKPGRLGRRRRRPGLQNSGGRRRRTEGNG